MRSAFHTTVTRALLAILASAALGALSGCGTSPRLDRQLGDAMRLSVAQQTLHPDAAYRSNHANGMDGRAAAAAYDNYLQSYTSPVSQADALSIGVGGHH